MKKNEKQQVIERENLIKEYGRNRAGKEVNLLHNILALITLT